MAVKRGECHVERFSGTYWLWRLALDQNDGGEDHELVRMAPSPFGYGSVRFAYSGVIGLAECCSLSGLIKAADADLDLSWDHSSFVLFSPASACDTM